MGLRCLFGHDFGDTEVEREREESENEVVVTVREVKVCEQCGDRRVVSENTEVTTVRTPDEVGLDDAAETDETADRESTHPTVEDGVDEEFEPPTDPAEDDGEILDEDVERGHGEWPQTDDSRVARAGAADDGAATDDAPGEDVPTAESGADPEAEGAEIIDGDDSDGDSDQQPWPTSSDGDDADESDDASGAPRAWPEHEGDDEGFSAQADDGASADVSAGDELAPVADEEKKQYVGHRADDGDVEDMVRADAAAAVERGSSADTEYFCPNCEHASRSDGSSMRPGDICPECHRGYIAERER